MVPKEREQNYPNSLASLCHRDKEGSWTSGEKPQEECEISGVIERFARYLDFDWAERRGGVNVADVKVLPVSHWQFPIRAAWQVAGGAFRPKSRILKVCSF
ncbi:MAG: hypothetical protein J6R18_07165 [Kiritimatiellae bacterium]|nr:hypothetical protein [Kiritimatiellia bacterium]